VCCLPPPQLLQLPAAAAAAAAAAIQRQNTQAAVRAEHRRDPTQGRGVPMSMCLLHVFSMRAPDRLVLEYKRVFSGWIRCGPSHNRRVSFQIKTHSCQPTTACVAALAPKGNANPHHDPWPHCC
jgi:hypothetical protein